VVHTGIATLPEQDAAGGGGAAYSIFPAVVELSSIGVGASWTPTPPLTFEASCAVPLKFAIPTQPHYEAYGRFIFRPLLLGPQPG
jgi:hypothetical protein